MRNTVSMDIPMPGQPVPAPRQKKAAPAARQKTHPFRRWLWWLCLLLAGGAAFYWFYTPSYGDYRAPLSIPLGLSGNFGELRDNHFHMGLDVRTNGQENLPVYAVADGYVSRVLIEQYRLGKALFITHSNGTTTVYAHLNSYYAALEKVVEAKQYKAQQPLVDISFPAGQFPVSKGDVIALSGNTGGSEAPHLHFEIRDTKTDRNLNPLLYGYSIDDDVPPVLKGLYWYNRQYSTYRSGASPISVEGGNGSYHTVKEVVKVRSPQVSLGIQAMDKNNDNRFLFGLYSVKLYLDDELVHEVQLDGFSYDDSRYINACVDYPRWMRTGAFVRHLSQLPGNHFPDSQGDGLLHLQDGAVHSFWLELQDVYHNKTTVQGRIQYTGTPEPAPALAAGAKLLAPGKEQTLTSAHAIVRFGKEAFYDTVPFLLRESPNGGPLKASPLIQLHSAQVPVHDDYTVLVKASPAQRRIWKNRIIMQLNDGRSLRVVKGQWEGDYLRGSFDKLGTVQLLVDTVPPSFQLAGWESGQSFKGSAIRLGIRARDESGGIASFRAELDGRWVLYDLKGGDFTVRIPEDCKAGKHALVIVLTDVAGNTSRRLFTFNKL